MSRRVSIKIDFDLDLQFWHLVPSVNINLHSRELEFEWMCFGIYARRCIEMEDIVAMLPANKSLFKKPDEQ